MKITQYQQMMAYLMRPKFNGGGSVGGNFVKPKKKPEKEVKKRKKENFEKAKDALENPDEVKEMMDLADGGRIGFDNGGSPRTITNQYGTFEVKGDDKRFTKSTVAKPKNGITFSEFRTKAATQPNFLKEAIKKLNPNKSYTTKDLFNLLGITTEKGNPKASEYFTGELKKAGIKSTANPTGGRGKQYKLKDVIKFFKENPKTTKLGKTSKEVADVRLGAEERLDKDLYDFNTRVTKNVRETAKAENVYLPKNLIGASAGDHIGHPVSLKITDKPEFKNLLKDSNVNKMNSLVFQDAVVNMEALNRNTGYDTKFNTYFKQLNKFLNKPITNKNRQELIDIKNDMDNHYNKVINKINETTKKNKFFKGQEKRIPKVTIDIPEVGSKFKSSNLFADMSTVDSEYRYGKVQKINPNAKFFKDLTSDQKQIFKQNIYNQYSDNLNSFYKQANLPTKDVEGFSEFIEAGGVKETVGKKDILSREEFKPGMQPDGQLKDLPGGNRKGLNLGLLKGAGETIKAIPTLAGGLALNLAFQPDLSSGVDRAALGAEAAFAPELVRQASRVTSNPIVQRFFNLGLSPQMALRAARIASPIGLATLAGEGLYQAGKYAIDRRKELQSMSPVERDRLRQESDAFSFNEFSAAGGGIAKLAGKSSGRPPESGPTPQGLDFLIKRGRQS